MPAVMNCSCGMQLPVSDLYVGRRVKCPSCGQACPVTEALPEAPEAPEPPSTPIPSPARAPGMVHFSCPCGKALQARAEFLGRSTRCPDCQAVVPIRDDSGAASPGEVYRPAPSTAPPLREPVSSPSTSAPSFDRFPDLRRKPGSSWGVVLGVLVVLGIAGGCAWYFLWYKDMRGKDLDLVPADAEFFVCLQFGDVWRTEVAKEVIRTLPPAIRFQMERGGGQDSGVGDLERAGVVVQDFEQRRIWMFLSISKRHFHSSANREAFLAGMEISQQSRKRTEKSFAGKTYYMLDTDHLVPGEGMAIYFFSDYTVVFGVESEVKLVMEKGTDRAKTGPMENAIARAKAREHLVFSLATSEKMRKEVQGNIPPEMKDLKDLAELRVLTMLANVKNRNVEFDLTASFPDDNAAAVSKQALVGGKGLVKVLGLGDLKKQAGPDGKIVIGDVEDAIGKAEIRQEGKDVKVHSTLAINPAAIGGMIRQLGGM